MGKEILEVVQHQLDLDVLGENDVLRKLVVFRGEALGERIGPVRILQPLDEDIPRRRGDELLDGRLVIYKVLDQYLIEGLIRLYVLESQLTVLQGPVIHEEADDLYDVGEQAKVQAAIVHEKFEHW